MGPEDGMVQLFDAPTDLMIPFSSWGDGGVFWYQKSMGHFAPMTAASRSRSHFEKTRFVTRMTKTIDDLEKATIFTHEDFRTQLISEVKLARGWTMFYLYQLFGPVPVIVDPAKVGDLVAESDLTKPERSVYVQYIIDDLRYAADHLTKDAAVYGRFNEGLALTLLMRLYMAEKDFQNAEDVGGEIVALGYGLATDYSSLFKIATERNNETIFAITCDGSSGGRGVDANFNPFTWYTYPGDGIDINGWGMVFVAPWSFYDSFDPSDTRRAMLRSSYSKKDALTGDPILVDQTSGLAGAIFDKYPRETATTFQGNDIPIARFADVKLMLAEAINENNNGPTAEAITLVNDVRHRAEIGDLPAEDIATKDAFNDAILRERGWELYFEGFRLPDLVRHGKWPSYVEAIPGKNPGPSIYPIPQYAVADGCAQNAEYN
jgi:hypothetical protein